MYGNKGMFIVPNRNGRGPRSTSRGLRNGNGLRGGRRSPSKVGIGKRKGGRRGSCK